MHAPQPLSRGVHRVGHPFGARTRCAAQCRAPTPSSARSGRTRGCARRMRCLRATTRGPRRRSAQGHAADAAAAREPARRRTRLPRRPSAPAAHSAPAQVIRAGALSSCAGRPHRQRTRLPAPDRPHRRPQLSARSPSPASSAQRQAALTGGVLSRVRRRCRRSASRRAAGVWLCAAHLRPFAVCAACLHSRRLCT